MPDPLFALQIVSYPNGEVVRLPAGGRLEADLVREVASACVKHRLGYAQSNQELVRQCTDAIVKRGVGFWRTEAHVRADIEAGLQEILATLTNDTEANLEAAIRSVLSNLKKATRGLA